MKCANCGANYPSRELRCPYCGTENPRGRLWKRQRAEADAQLAEAEAQRPLLRAQAANKILGRVLLAEGAALLLLVVVSLLLFGGESLLRRVPKQQAEQTMQQLYDEGRFDQLYAYMDEHDLVGSEYYQFSQAALLHYDYDDFCIRRMGFYDQLLAGKRRTSWTPRCWFRP